MDRSEVIKGLEAILDYEEVRRDHLPVRAGDTLRAALALLRVPEAAEIEAVRVEANLLLGAGRVKREDKCFQVVLRALDALAREPELKAEAERYHRERDILGEEVAGLHDDIRALTADRDEWRTQHENLLACQQAERDDLRRQRDALLAAAKDPATPTPADSVVHVSLRWYQALRAAVAACSPADEPSKGG